MEWISVRDRMPEDGTQTEVVFYANPYEWWTGLYTPKGFCGSDESVFEAHFHFDDDTYRQIKGVTHWMPLPPPPKTE